MSVRIRNDVSFTCDEQRLHEILEAIQYDNNGKNYEYGIGTIDFNKIIPVSKRKDRYNAWNTDCEAIQCSYYGGHTITFDTDDNVEPVIQKLSSMFEGVQLTYSWNGDSWNRCCGYAKYENGVYLEGYYYDFNDYVGVPVAIPDGFGSDIDETIISFIPELVGVDRNDHNAIKAYALKEFQESSSLTPDSSGVQFCNKVNLVKHLDAFPPEAYDDNDEPYYNPYASKVSHVCADDEFPF